MQNEPILGDIFRYSATGSSIKKPVFMRVCGHFEARRTIRHDPNDVAPKPEAPGSSPGRRTKNAVISMDRSVFSFCLSSKFHSCYRVKRLHGTTN